MSINLKKYTTEISQAPFNEIISHQNLKFWKKFINNKI